MSADQNNGRIPNLEKRVEQISSDVSEIKVSVGVLVERGTWRDTDSARQSTELVVVSKDVVELAKRVRVNEDHRKNRWPTLLAAAAGGSLPVLGYVIMFHDKIGGP